MATNLLHENLILRPAPSPFSLSEKIYIRFHKQEYAAGDTIYGLVYLWVSTPVASQVLKISLQGFEETMFEIWQIEEDPDDHKNPIRHKVERLSRKDTVPKFEAELASYPRGFPLGYFCYPFKYELPQVMPGSFSCKAGETNGLKWNAVVSYVIRASVDIPGAHHDLWVEEEVCIREAKPSISLPRSVMNTQIQSCFCIPRGSIEVSAWLDKNIYRPGENLTIHYTIHNTSSVDVQSIQIKLVRVIKLTGGPSLKFQKPLAQSISVSNRTLPHAIHPNVLPGTFSNKDTSTNMEVLFTLALPGCKHNTNIIRDALTTLTADAPGQTILPTTHASNIKCTYVLDIEVRAKWAASILLTLPILVLPSLDEQWLDWSGPVWIRKCAKVQVTGECGIESSLISEQFSSIPGVVLGTPPTPSHM